MARVMPSDVQVLIPTQRDVMPFILAASMMVDNYLGLVGYPELLLTEIERWWAAHLVACAEPQVTEKRLGQTSVKMSGPRLGEGLAGTSYGQQVLVLDTKKMLTTLTDVKRAMFEVL